MNQPTVTNQCNEERSGNNNMSTVFLENYRLTTVVKAERPDSPHSSTEDDGISSSEELHDNNSRKRSVDCLDTETVSSDSKKIKPEDERDPEDTLNIRPFKHSVIVASQESDSEDYVVKSEVSVEFDVNVGAKSQEKRTERPQNDISPSTNPNDIKQALQKRSERRGTRGKMLDGDARNIVYNVIKYFEEEKKLGRCYPLENSNARASLATGISKNTISRIKKEGDLARKQGVQLQAPGKGRRGCNNTRVPVDEFTLTGIKAIIDSIDLRKEVPSLNNILDAAKKNFNFKGSKTTLRTILINRLGCTFEKKTGWIISNRSKDEDKTFGDAEFPESFPGMEILQEQYPSTESLPGQVFIDEGLEQFCDGPCDFNIS